MDAGADLVVGHHAHIAKGVETYRGKAIVYSLNNFVLRPRGDDGEWLSADNTPSDQQRTLVLRCVIRDGRLTRVAFLPCWIGPDACPELLPATDPRADLVFDYVRWASAEAGLPVVFTRDGDELVVGLP